MDSATILAALDNGTYVTDAMMDRALARLIKVQMRLGFYNQPKDLPEWGQWDGDLTTHLNTVAHQELALQAADQALVLLKNNNSKGEAVLPLDVQFKKTVAVIGPNAKATSGLLSNYHGTPGVKVASPLLAISEHVDTVVYSLGCPMDDYRNSTQNISAAVEVASRADAVILVVGNDGSTGGGEGHDRAGISLAGAQDQLISEVAAAARGRGPVIVVIISGESVDLAPAKNNPDVDAIIWQGYPGQAGANATARAIFGVTNPSGRLPITLYEASYANQVSMADMGMRPNMLRKNPGRTYRFFGGAVGYPFGAGGSFTTFKHVAEQASGLSLALSDVSSSLAEFGQTPHLAPTLANAVVEVTNTGTRAGAQSVLCFAVPPGAGTNGVPIKKLVDFGRVILQPGASATVTCNVTAVQLSEPHPVSGELVARGGTWRLRFGDADVALTVNT